MTRVAMIILASVVTAHLVTQIGPLGLIVSAAGFGIGYGAGVLVERWGQP